MKKITMILLLAGFILSGCMTQLRSGAVLADPCIHIDIDCWDRYDCCDCCDGWRWVRCDCCDCWDCDCWCWRPTFWYCLFHDCSRPPRHFYHHRTYVDGRWRYYTESGSYFHYSPSEGMYVTRRGLGKEAPDQQAKSSGIREAERAEVTQESRSTQRIKTSSKEKKEEQPVYRTKSTSSDSRTKTTSSNNKSSSSSSKRSKSTQSSNRSKSTTRRTK